MTDLYNQFNRIKKNKDIWNVLLLKLKRWAFTISFENETDFASNRNIMHVNSLVKVTFFPKVYNTCSWCTGKSFWNQDISSV